MIIEVEKRTRTNKEIEQNGTPFAFGINAKQIATLCWVSDLNKKADWWIYYPSQPLENLPTVLKSTSSVPKRYNSGKSSKYHYDKKIDELGFSEILLCYPLTRRASEIMITSDEKKLSIVVQRSARGLLTSIICPKGMGTYCIFSCFAKIERVQSSTSIETTNIHRMMRHIG